MQTVKDGSTRRRSSRFKKLLYWPEAFLMAAVSLALRPLTNRGRLRVGTVLGRLFWILSSRRRLSVDNARLALGVGADEARRIARAAHVNLGRLAVEFLTSGSQLDPARLALLEVKDFEHMRRAYDAGGGVILVTAHLGNWELLGVKQGLEGIAFSALARAPKNPYVARRLEASRRFYGLEPLPRRWTLIRAAKRLKAGGCIGTAIDQHTRTAPKMASEFLGRRAVLSTAIFELAVLVGCPVVPCVTYPKADGGYRLVYYPPLRAAETGSREERVLDLAGRCYRLAESWIRENPESWFWFHDLWKRAPSTAGKDSTEAQPSTMEA